MLNRLCKKKLRNLKIIAEVTRTQQQQSLHMYRVVPWYITI
jgi:hypothetical protein